MCRQGVVNTRPSGVFVALFTRLFCSNVGGSVSLRSAHQVLVRHVGNVLACFMSAEGWGRWGWQSCVSSYAPFRTPRQAGYGVLLTWTNCLSVRSEQILLWVSLAGLVKESLLQCCPVPCETLCDFTIQSWSDVLPLLSCSLMHTYKNRSCIGKKANEEC